MDKKSEIIKRSYHLMHLYGYNGTSVKKITDAAEIPKGSFYNYFQNKEEYAKCVIEHFRHKESIFYTFEEDELTSAEQISLFFKNQIKYFKKKNYKYGCFVGNLTQEMADVSPVLAKTAEDFHQFVAVQLEQSLIRGVESGEFVLPVDAKKLSNFLINAWQGTLLRMKSNQDDQVLDDYLEILKRILS